MSRPARLAAAAVAGLLLAGCAACSVPARGAAGSPSPRPGDRASAQHRPPPDVAGFRSVRTYDLPALPRRVRVPKIGVSSLLLRLGRSRDGTLEVPKPWGTAGWYDLGPRPGQPGPAVLLGHVDSRAGPAVFFRLRELRPADAVFVDLADGTTLRFRVDRVERYPKDRFPTQAVYFPTLNRELRLITCGGQFDYAHRNYLDNIVVYATLVG